MEEGVRIRRRRGRDSRSTGSRQARYERRRFGAFGRGGLPGVAWGRSGGCPKEAGRGPAPRSASSGQVLRETGVKEFAARRLPSDPLPVSRTPATAQSLLGPPQLHSRSTATARRQWPGSPPASAVPSTGFPGFADRSSAATPGPSGPPSSPGARKPLPAAPAAQRRTSSDTP